MDSIETTQMNNYYFRLKFNFLDGDSVASDQEKLPIIERSNGFSVRLVSGEKDRPIRSKSTSALIGGPYLTYEDAKVGGDNAKRSLLIWAVTNQFGVDFGDGKVRSLVTEEGLKSLTAKLGVPLRNDIHGIDIYQHQDSLQFVRFEATTSLAKNEDDFINFISNEFNNPKPLTEKQVISAELYCSSFFDISFRSRVVTLINSIEAMLEPEDRNEQASDVVQAMIDFLQDSNLNKSEKESICGSLQWLKKDSISQAGRKFCQSLLPEGNYMNMPSPKFFTYCYNIRCKIVHSGGRNTQKIDFLHISNILQVFVKDLILASLNQNSLTCA